LAVLTDNLNFVTLLICAESEVPGAQIN
jgi:hypothetical protein